MSVSTVVIVIVVFLALDVLFYFLIIRSMERPSPSAAFARARNLSVIPDSEGASVGLRLRQRLPIPRGDLLDIVGLALPAGEGYLFTTLPDSDSHLPKAQENRRQFIAVLVDTPADGGLFIHPPIRFPFAGFKWRRLSRIFKTKTYVPIPPDRVPPALAGRWRVRAEHAQSDPRSFFTKEVTPVLASRMPRARGAALLACPDGVVVYINPLLKDELEAGKFYDFTRMLVGAIAKQEG